MNYIILYFILNSAYYELPLLPNMTKDDAIKLEIIPTGAKEITKDEYDKQISIKLSLKKQLKK